MKSRYFRVLHYVSSTILTFVHRHCFLNHSMSCPEGQRQNDENFHGIRLFFHISSLTFRERFRILSAIKDYRRKKYGLYCKEIIGNRICAAAIVRHAEEQKEVLDHEFREKRNQFDEELEKKTMEKINEIRSELEKTTSSLLDEQSGENNDSIALLKQQYEINHTKYAKDILKRITEV